MQMKLKLTAAAALVMVTGLASAQDMVVKIGHVAPVSGAQASYGKDNENGARMAIEDLNAQGVTIGGKKSSSNWLLKTTQPIPSKVQPLHKNCATPKSLAWPVT